MTQMTRLTLAGLSCLLILGCGPDQNELERRTAMLGDVCEQLSESRLRSVLPIAEAAELEFHRPPSASHSNHRGCVVTWDTPRVGVVVGFDVYLHSGRGPEPGERIERLLERGEYRAARQFTYEPVSAVGDQAAYNSELNMIAWSHRGHLFYINATDLPGIDRDSLAELARLLNRDWPV